MDEREKNTGTKAKIQKAVLYISYAYIAFMVIYSSSGEPEFPGPESPPQRLITEESNCLGFRWEIPNVISARGNVRSPMVAENGSLFVLASFNPGVSGGLISLDGFSGIEKWRVQNVQIVATDNQRLYHRLSTQSVSARTFDGEVIWTKRLLFVRSITSIVIIDKYLHVITDSSMVYWLDSETGEVLKRSEYDVDSKLPYFVREAINYKPVIVDDIFYYRLGNSSSRTAAVIARHIDGKILWRTEQNTISNPGVTDSYVYVLIDSGVIQVLDRSTGQVIESVRIEPPLDFWNPETDVDYAGYEIAVDNENKLLYVLLGNSDQLFAFDIKCE